MDDYWTDFLQESEEHITELNNALLTLEDDPDDDAALDDIFRTAHTLKGNCGAMGLSRASDLAHAIEELLDAIRRGEVAVTAERMDTVFEAVDELEAMIDEVADDGEITTDPTATIDRLRERTDGEVSGITLPADDEIEDVLSRFDPPSDDDHDAFLARLAVDETDEEVSHGVLVLEALADAFDLLGADPPRETLESGEYGGRFDAVFGSAVQEEAIAAALEPVDAVTAFRIVNVTDRFESSTAAPDDGGDVSADRAREMEVDELLDEFEEFDDLDEMVEEVEDVSAFEDMGEAGSFDKLLGEEELEEERIVDDALEADDVDTDDGTADEDAPVEGEPDDAEAVFEELQQEVEMVGFDELQNELADLEFDEFDSDDEVGMDELLGDEVDVDDGSFLDVEEGDLDDAVDEMLVDEPAAPEGDDAEVAPGDETAVDDAVDDLVTADSDALEGADAVEGDDDSLEVDGAVEADDDAVEAAMGDEIADEDLEAFALGEALESDDAEVATADEREVDGVDALDEIDFDAGDGATGETRDATPVDETETGADPAVETADGDPTAADTAVGPDGEDATGTAEDAGDPTTTAAPDDEPGTASAEDGSELAADDEPEPTSDVDDEMEPAVDEDGGSEPAVDDDDDSEPEGDDESEPVPALEDESDPGIDDPTGGFDSGTADLETSDIDDGFDAVEADADDTLEVSDEFDAEAESAYGSAELDDLDGPTDDSFADDAFGAEETEPAESEAFDAGFDPSETEFDPTAETSVDDSTSGNDVELGDDSDDSDDVTVDDGTSGMPIPDIDFPDETELAATDDADTIQSIRVGVDQVDSLMNLVEGLVTSRVRIRHAIESGEDPQTLDRELDDLEGLTSELQETVMDVRLVPLGTIANRLPRVVRDIARDQDKEVDFEMNGEDVELDRSILDRIGDPLIHLVRNAVDHGIEPPDERDRHDKPLEGTVELRAERSRDRVTIEVEDDGRGLDPDRLRSTAVEAGVIGGDEADAMPDEEVYELIFHSGLSTVEEVTDVSGRGVGMDIVKRTIEDLDGTVAVESEPGEGTTVRMTVPVSVAIAEVMFVEAGGEEFGLPVKAIQNIGGEDDVETVADDTVFVGEDDEERPVIRLDETLDTPDAGVDGDGMVVRIRDDVRRVALYCDEVHGQREVVVKPFEGFMGDIPGLSGATVRGRGEVVNILDVTSL